LHGGRLRMPPVSQAQRRWAWANKDKKTKEGRAAKEFAEADPGGKLPEKKKKLRDMYRKKKD
jgi:hypothetical protein